MHRTHRANRIPLIAAAWFLAVCCCPITRGETPEVLHLKNGDRFSGYSEGLQQGLLLWRMPFGERVAIPLEDVDRLEKQVLPLIGPPPEPGPVPVIGPEPELIDGPAFLPDPPFLLGPLRPAYMLLDSAFDSSRGWAGDWFKRAELGGQWAQGNTNQEMINFAAQLERLENQRFIQVDVIGQYAESEETITAHRWFLNGTVDWWKDPTSKWILFVTAKNQYDLLENLNYRGTYSGGLGYRFINELEKRVVARLGPGMTVESFRDPSSSRVTPDLFAELEMRWPFFDRTVFEQKTTLFPSIADMSVFRLVSASSLSFRIDERKRWNLGVGFRWEHNSDPNTGRDPNDLLTTLSIIYTRQ